MRLSGGLSVILGSAALATATPAWADRIDGEWCSASSSLKIEGPQIRTPGGNTIEGNYGRHDFSYRVPSSEPDAGAEITMRLYGEENMTLSRAGKPDVNWKRCRVTS
jgi:hypothetical protein